MELFVYRQGIHMLSFVVSTLYREHSITFMTQFFLLLLNPPNMRGIETLLQYDVTFQHFISFHPWFLVHCTSKSPYTTSYSGIYIFYCQSYSYWDLVFGNRHLSFDIVIIILLSIDCTTIKVISVTPNLSHEVLRCQLLKALSLTSPTPTMILKDLSQGS